MVFDAIFQTIVHHEIQLADGSTVGLDLPVLQQNVPAQKIFKQYPVKLFKVKSEPLWRRLAQQRRCLFRIAIPRPELLINIFAEGTTWLKCQWGLQQLGRPA